ncbi:restriction endonuclease subunit S [Tenacibaculum maritimum]|uniref:restriction endonuclease subunit S n=2 Tax=Tenacibaculum maritimum TaxID=107401 RepID=UPI00388E5EB6
MGNGYMYILECADGSYYTGSTKNLEIRLLQHQKGNGANHTKKRLPVKLVYVEEFDRIDEAFKREKQIQGWSRKKKEALINNQHHKLPKLSMAYRDVASSASASERSASASENKNVLPDNTVASSPSATGNKNVLPEGLEVLPEGLEGKEQIPKLRFKEFNENYKRYSFKDTFIFSTGKNIKQKEASPEFETPCVRYGELYHMYNEVIHEIINNTNLEKSELLFSKGDEILLPSAGEDPLDIGSASALTVKDVAIGRTINILRPLKKNIYSSIYVSYYINQKLRKKISTLAKGSSISNVYNSDLKKLEIKLPKLEEQQKIASFLSSVDKKIELLQKKKALIEEYKRGVMQKIFSQELRFKPDLSKVEGDDGESNYPDWEENNLGNIFYSEKGNGISKAELDSDGKYKCILYGELYTKYNEIVLDVISKTNSVSGLNSKKGDLLIPSSTTTTGIDLANVTALNFENIKLGGDIIVLRSNQEINNIFYAYYLSNYKKQQIASRAQGITIVHLYYNSIKDLMIHIPSLQEQTKIANFLSAIDAKIQLVNTQLENITVFKKGLLQQMFV